MRNGIRKKLEYQEEWMVTETIYYSSSSPLKCLIIKYKKSIICHMSFIMDRDFKTQRKNHKESKIKKPMKWWNFSIQFKMV